MAVNSEPKDDDSTMFWRLDDHMMEALSISIIIPICDRLVLLHPVWHVSIKHGMFTGLSCASVAIEGIVYAAYW